MVDGYNSSQFVISENNYETSMDDLGFEEPESLTRKKRYVSLLGIVEDILEGGYCQDSLERFSKGSCYSPSPFQNQLQLY